MTTPIPAITPLRADEINNFRVLVAEQKARSNFNIQFDLAVSFTERLIATIDALSAPAPAEPRPTTVTGQFIAEARAEAKAQGENSRGLPTLAADGSIVFAPRPARPDAGEAVAWTALQIAKAFRAYMAATPWGKDKEPTWIDREVGRMIGALPAPPDANAAAELAWDAHPPAASAETARVAELEAAERDLFDHVKQYMECEGNPDGVLIRMGLRAVAWYKIRAALGAQEVQS